MPHVQANRKTAAQLKREAAAAKARERLLGQQGISVGPSGAKK